MSAWQFVIQVRHWRNIKEKGIQNFMMDKWEIHDVGSNNLHMIRLQY